MLSIYLLLSIIADIRCVYSAYAKHILTPYSTSLIFTLKRPYPL